MIVPNMDEDQVLQHCWSILSKLVRAPAWNDSWELIEYQGQHYLYLMDVQDIPLTIGEFQVLQEVYKDLCDAK